MQKQYKQAKNKVQNVSCAKLYYFKFNTSFARVKILLAIKRICSSHFPVSRTLTSSKWKLHSWSLSSDQECSFHFEDGKVLETGKWDEQIRFIESILLKYDKQNLNTCERSIKLEIV